MSLMRECEGIKLDVTYIGKALTALIDDAKDESLPGKSALFWDTINSRSRPQPISNLDYHDLPRCFHRYFQEKVQPLDRDTDG